MQAVARENAMAETAFVLPRPDTDGCLPLRWFTPEVEIDLCGHATLATAHVLFREEGFPGTNLRFSTKSGVLAASREAGGRTQLDFPARPATPRPDLIRAVGKALGAQPEAVQAARDLLAVFPKEEDVAALRPDMELVARLEGFALIATAPGREVDFVSRFFAPKAGIPEGPVTGSAHCTLVPYWASRLGKTAMSARQISARGGELSVLLEDDRVRMAGACAVYCRGELDLPEKR
jgi:PhzF family phenazine biosynthesis protein